MCDILTMTCFDDYPDLMATGSAISLISGVSPVYPRVDEEADILGWRKSFRSSNLRLAILHIYSISSWIIPSTDILALHGSSHYTSCNTGPIYTERWVKTV